MNLVIISSLALKCQDFKVEMLFFQPLCVMKLKTSKFKVLAFRRQWRYHYQIQIKYWNASASGFPSSLIPVLHNIGILHYKKAKLRKHLQHSACTLYRGYKAFDPPDPAAALCSKRSTHYRNTHERLNEARTLLKFFERGCIEFQ